MSGTSTATTVNVVQSGASTAAPRITVPGGVPSNGGVSWSRDGRSTAYQHQLEFRCCEFYPAASPCLGQNVIWLMKPDAMGMIRLTDATTIPVIPPLWRPAGP